MIHDIVKERSMQNKCFNTDTNTGYLKRKNKQQLHIGGAMKTSQK